MADDGSEKSENVNFHYGFGMTFTVPRAKMVAMLEAKAQMYDRVASIWAQVPGNTAYINMIQKAEHDKAVAQARANGRPGGEVSKIDPALIDSSSKMSVKKMQEAAKATREQAELLSPRDFFLLTQEQLANLQVNDQDKYAPANWDEFVKSSS